MIIAVVKREECVGCATCVSVCPMSALSIDEDGVAVVDGDMCVACGACEGSCPVGAISVEEVEEEEIDE